MAHPARYFLPSRRLFLAGGIAALASPVPAYADVAPDLLTGSVARFAAAKIPAPVPDIEFRDSERDAHTLADFKGKVVLINFWATWCAPCVKEMPSLNKLQGEISKDKFIILPLSVDGPSRSKVAPFYKVRNLNDLGIYFDKNHKAMRKLGISVLPTSILVDAEGNELGRLEGDADWGTPEALTLMQSALGKQG